MKNSAWYNKLWQDKMLELTIEEDGDAAWKNMQGLLDQHMPATPAAVVTKPGKPWWVKLISIIAVVTAVALLYYAGRHFFANDHQKNIKQTNQQHTQLNADSVENKNDLIKPFDQHYNSAVTDDGQPNEKTEQSGKEKNKVNANKIAGNSSSTNNILANNATSNHHRTNGKNATGNSLLAVNESGKMKSQLDGNPANHNNTAANHATDRSSVAINEPNSKVKNKLTGLGSKHTSKATVDLNRRAKNSSSSATGKGIYSSNLQKQHAANHHLNKNGNGYKLTSKSNQHNLTDHSTLQVTDNSNNGTTVTNDALSKNTSPATSSKADTTGATTLKTIAAASKKTIDAKADQSKDDKSAKNKSPGKAKSGNSKFELDAKVGLNTSGAFTSSSQNNNFYGKSRPDIFLGIAANYRIHNKLGIGIGLNILSPKLLSGSYSKSNLNYTTVTIVHDTSKTITHNSGKITIKGTRKVYSVDVPIVLSYKVTDKFTVTGGPVISIPVRAGSNKNTLGTLSSSADTTTVKTVTPYVNSTTINNKVNFSITAGVKYNINRFYIEANYLQGANPYTISSGLGSGKIYYHTIQIGIGFRLFKSKK